MATGLAIGALISAGAGVAGAIDQHKQNKKLLKEQEKQQAEAKAQALAERRQTVDNARAAFEAGFSGGRRTMYGGGIGLADSGSTGTASTLG